jgi:hypothetical protein
VRATIRRPGQPKPARRQIAACRLFLLTAFVPWHSEVTRAQTRSEIPIRETVLTDGVRRYGVPIRVGATMIEAGLDSGSTGLRILPGVLAAADAQASNTRETYAFESGASLTGQVGTGTLAIGELSAPASMELINLVGCGRNRPRCPASRLPVSQFGIMGDGLPGEGFRAILGVNMAEARIRSPLSAIGARRWIVEVPQPDSGMPGKLILNPADDELNGFVMLPILYRLSLQQGGFHDAVTGCIVSDATGERICGALLMDTGADAIDIRGAGNYHWPAGSAATLAFYDKEQLVAGEKITIDSPSHASHLAFGPAERGQKIITILAGLAPYFAFDVLYDPEKKVVGLKPRPPAPGAPIAAVALPTN